MFPKLSFLGKQQKKKNNNFQWVKYLFFHLSIFIWKNFFLSFQWSYGGHYRRIWKMKLLVMKKNLLGVSMRRNIYRISGSKSRILNQVICFICACIEWEGICPFFHFFVFTSTVSPFFSQPKSLWDYRNDFIKIEMHFWSWKKIFEGLINSWNWFFEKCPKNDDNYKNFGFSFIFKDVCRQK